LTVLHNKQKIILTNLHNLSRAFKFESSLARKLTKSSDLHLWRDSFRKANLFS
jgi:hypothetical protein